MIQEKIIENLRVRIYENSTMMGADVAKDVEGITTKALRSQSRKNYE